MFYSQVEDTYLKNAVMLCILESIKIRFLEWLIDFFSVGGKLPFVNIVSIFVDLQNNIVRLRV